MAHVDYGSVKAANEAVARIVPNVGGPRSSKRYLLVSDSTFNFNAGKDMENIDEDAECYSRRITRTDSFANGSKSKG